MKVRIGLGSLVLGTLLGCAASEDVRPIGGGSGGSDAPGGAAGASGSSDAGGASGAGGLAGSSGDSGGSDSGGASGAGAQGGPGGSAGSPGAAGSSGAGGAAGAAGSGGSATPSPWDGQDVDFGVLKLSTPCMSDDQCTVGECFKNPEMPDAEGRCLLPCDPTEQAVACKISGRSVGLCVGQAADGSVICAPACDCEHPCESGTCHPLGVCGEAAEALQCE